MSQAAFTDEELDFGADHSVLGPAYLAARDLAEKFMAPFEAEHFKPLIDKFASDFQDKLWSDLEASLLSDVESNLQGSLWRMVDGTINALLTGEQWALNRYAMAQARYGDAEKVRAAVAKHLADDLARERIADLESQLKDARETIERQRRY
jgi:hypothetical protein